jgi:hypothetical protein
MRDPSKASRRGEPMSRTLKVVLVILGSFAALFVVLIVTASLVLPGKLREGTQNAAHKIADFTVPAGLTMTFGFSLGPMSEVTLTSTDPAKPLVILLVGFNGPRAAGNDDAFGANFMKAQEQHCTHIEQLPDELIAVNGAIDLFHRVVCSSVAGSKQIMEFGQFAGRSPVAVLTATGPAQGWDAQPIHALLNSIH